MNLGWFQCIPKCWSVDNSSTSTVASAAAAASEGTDEVDGVTDALLPLASNLHTLLVVVNDQEGGRSQLQVVLLLKVFRRPDKYK